MPQANGIKLMSVVVFMYKGATFLLEVPERDDDHISYLYLCVSRIERTTPREVGTRPLLNVN